MNKYLSATAPGAHEAIFGLSQTQSATRDPPRPIKDFSVVPEDLQLIESLFFLTCGQRRTIRSIQCRVVKINSKPHFWREEIISGCLPFKYPEEVWIVLVKVHHFAKENVPGQLRSWSAGAFIDTPL